MHSPEFYAMTPEFNRLTLGPLGAVLGYYQASSSPRLHDTAERIRSDVGCKRLKQKLCSDPQRGMQLGPGSQG